MKIMNLRLCRIQYTSGLYVDKFEKTVGAHFVKPISTVLILNGNIGKPQNQQTYDFLKHCNRLWAAILYVPGTYELSDGYKQIDIMKDAYKSLVNVHVMHNSSYYFPYIDTLFLGTVGDKSWLNQTFVQKNAIYSANTKFVAVTNCLPDCTMVHPSDKIININDKKPIYPPVNAWFSGYSRGAFKRVYNNGVICAYNARGPIDGKNDFNQTLGWSRSAYLDLTS